MKSQTSIFSDSGSWSDNSSIPSSPETTGCKKRSREWDESSPIKDTGKRIQRTRMHSEVHQNTVSMMMNAQRLIQEQEKLFKMGGLEEMEEEEANDKQGSNYQQKSFWPAITRVVHR